MKGDINLQTLLANYVVLNYLPEFGLAEQLRFEYLKNINCILVFNKEELKEQEIRDVVRVYCAHSSIKNKIACVDTNHYAKLLKEIAVAHKQKLKLVVLGHAYAGANIIAGLTPEEMTSMVRQYPNIDKIVLFGCRSSQADKLEEEKEIIRNFHLTQSKLICGLVVVRNRSALDYDKLFKNTNADKLYILEAEGNGENRFIIQVEKTNDGTFDIKEVSLTLENELKLKKAFTKNIEFHLSIGKKLDFAVLRNQAKPLKPSEVEFIASFFGDKFHPQHPNYKSIKEKYPFLRSFKINENEAADKIKDSLLKKLMECIRKDDGIHHPIQIKGYSRLILVDNLKKQFHVLNNYSYVNAYKKSLFFDSGTDNIVRKELYAERSKLIQSLQTGETDGSTMSKAVSIKMNYGS